MTASPRAVLGEPLDELERLANGALEWMAAEREDTGREIRPGEVVHRIACRELHAACTPERIAQLVALARQAEACEGTGSRVDFSRSSHDAPTPQKLSSPGTPPEPTRAAVCRHCGATKKGHLRNFAGAWCMDGSGRVFAVVAPLAPSSAPRDVPAQEQDEGKTATAPLPRWAVELDEAIERGSSRPLTPLAAPTGAAAPTEGAVGSGYTPSAQTIADAMRGIDAPAPGATPLRTRTEDYRVAPSGMGPLAAEWTDKPHRLVYDLCAEIDRLRGSGLLVCGARSASSDWPCSKEPGHHDGHENAYSYWPRLDSDTCEPVAASPAGRAPARAGTTPVNAGELACDAEDDGFICNLPPGHDGQHEAYAGADMLCHAWPAPINYWEANGWHPVYCVLGCGRVACHVRGFRVDQATCSAQKRDGPTTWAGSRPPMLSRFVANLPRSVPRSS